MEEREKKQTTVYVEEAGQLSPVEPGLSDPGVGKAWRRKYDGLVFFGAVYLGVYETKNDFEMIDVSGKMMG